VTYAKLQKMFSVKCLCAFDNLLNMSCEFKRNEPHINEANMMIRVGEGKAADRVSAGKRRSVGTK
jgi:hypothetical protein